MVAGGEERSYGRHQRLQAILPKGNKEIKEIILDI